MTDYQMAPEPGELAQGLIDLAGDLAREGQPERAALVHQALTGLAMDNLRWKVLADELVAAFGGDEDAINNIEGFVNARGNTTGEWKFGDTACGGEEPLGS